MVPPSPDERTETKHRQNLNLSRLCFLWLKIKRRVVCALLFASTGGCSVGPNYHRPLAPVPTTYKELKGWKSATPNDTVNRGAWWSIYRDPTLNSLERDRRL